MTNTPRLTPHPWIPPFNAKPSLHTEQTKRHGSTPIGNTISVELLGRENGSYQDTTARASLIPLVSSAKKAFFD